MEKDEGSAHIEEVKIPRTFVMKRFSSLAGLFIVLFLFEHLITNSQAALFFGEYGKGFIDAVNFIYSLPYLPVLECVLLGVPIGFHAYWGLMYLYESKPNSFASNGSRPALAKLPRNQAYTWQRITAIVLIVGIGLHVAYMRFLRHPAKVGDKNRQEFLVRISKDPGLFSLQHHLDLTLYSTQDVAALEQTLTHELKQLSTKKPQNIVEERLLHEEMEQKKEYLRLLHKKKISQHQLLATSQNFGTATLLVVRDTFKSVWTCMLYSLFVCAACFHAMNGVATFAISWGLTMTERSRMLTKRISNALMLLLLFLGLISIWGSYWINLRY